ncbi:hypothetical protein HK101_002008 [Irineochytrium annulatum]|nr:hypothetical protein HK101_002008 [Irineochytrium annulatum]
MLQRPVHPTPPSVQTGSSAGGQGAPSGVSDHLSVAVGNLYHMVERRYEANKPQPATQQPNPSSSSPHDAPLTPELLGPGDPSYLVPRRPHNINNRASNRASWTTTAIESEVSRLYKYGESAFPSPTPANMPPMPRDPSGWWPADISPSAAGASQGSIIARSPGGKGGRASLADLELPVTMALFCYGFLLFPCWFAGSVMREDTRWRHACRIAAASFVSVVAVGVILFLVLRNRM